MPVLGDNGPVTLVDWANALDPGGAISAVAEILHESNNVWVDAHVTAGNTETGNKTTQRTSLPEVTRRGINEGVKRTKSTRKPVVDNTVLFTTWSVVDLTMLELMGDGPEFLMSEHAADIEAIGQDHSDVFIYGHEGQDPASFNGLTSRYPTLGPQVIDGGGATNLTSIWAVTWGPSKNSFIFPKHGKSGINYKDYNSLPVLDENSNPFPGYQRYYELQSGLVVRDPRFNARVANLSVDEMAGAGEPNYTGPNLELLLIEALNRMPHQFNPAPANSGQGSRTVIYMNADTMTAMEKIAVSKANMYLRWQEFGGQSILTFRGYPIRRVDKIRNDETAVV